MQKQSQTKPIYIVFIRVNSWLNSNQSQTKPTCGELVESIFPACAAVLSIKENLPITLPKWHRESEGKGQKTEYVTTSNTKD
jgi:hypothetical protein